MDMEKPSDISIPLMDGLAGYPKRLDAKLPSTTPITSPMIPPMRQMMTASTKNCALMEEFLAPNAFLVPISLVRSVTLTSIMFMTPMPPTKRAMPAMMEIAVVMVDKSSSSIPTRPVKLMAVTLKSGLPL